MMPLLILLGVASVIGGILVLRRQGAIESRVAGSQPPGAVLYQGWMFIALGTAVVIGGVVGLALGY